MQQKPSWLTLDSKILGSRGWLWWLPSSLSQWAYQVILEACGRDLILPTFMWLPGKGECLCSSREWLRATIEGIYSYWFPPGSKGQLAFRFLWLPLSSLCVSEIVCLVPYSITDLGSVCSDESMLWCFELTLTEVVSLCQGSYCAALCHPWTTAETMEQALAKGCYFDFTSVLFSSSFSHAFQCLHLPPISARPSSGPGCFCRATGHRDGSAVTRAVPSGHFLLTQAWGAITSTWKTHSKDQCKREPRLS